MKFFTKTHHAQQYPSAAGYMTASAQKKYINREIKRGNMPPASLRVPKIASLNASPNKDDPLYFWQLYSVLGKALVLGIVKKFYKRVFDDQEEWFRSAFARIAPFDHHVQTQSSMWIDCFGGGQYYHGGQYRLEFHHANNAAAIMTQGGAERWVMHMVSVLDEEDNVLRACDPRARSAINSFLEYFMSKYADQFDFDSSNLSFGKETPAISLRGRAEDDLRNTPTSALKLGLMAEEVDITDSLEKQDLVAKALALGPQ
jgi:truncated hemoglobin YjbI